MADRNIENNSQEIPEIPELVEKVLLFALDEGKSKMEQGAEVVPFTALVVKDNLFIETHPGDNADECFFSAQKTVGGARGADAYAFCYDGYVDTDTGQKDILIAEGGLPGCEEGFAVGYLYNMAADGTVTFEEEPAYIGEAPNFMEGLKDSAEYTDAEISARYLDDECCDDECDCANH